MLLPHAVGFIPRSPTSAVLIFMYLSFLPRIMVTGTVFKHRCPSLREDNVLKNAL